MGNRIQCVWKHDMSEMGLNPLRCGESAAYRITLEFRVFDRWAENSRYTVTHALCEGHAAELRTLERQDPVYEIISESKIVR